MKKCLFIIFILFLSFIGWVIFTNKTKPTITYFPINNNVSFDTATTTLSIDEKKSSTLNWQSLSKSNTPIYLRQDVSLLFEDGKLKGVLSKWDQHTEKIRLKRQLPIRQQSLYEAISLHYGEVHHENNDINSVYYMSGDLIYVDQMNDMKQQFFKQPKTTNEKKTKRSWDQSIKGELTEHWNELMTHYNIDKNEYMMEPLTGLQKYNEQTLPNVSKRNTAKIIGQLWEGIYKNYVIPITTEDIKEEQYDHYMPIILFAKDNTHLIVLYELNGKKQMLLQHYQLI